MVDYPPSSLQFSTATGPGGLVVKLIGQLGMPPHTDKLREELVRIYGECPKILVFDLSQLTFVSSLGIGIFAEANRRLRRDSGHLRLCCVQRQVMEVFERTRMTAVFEFAENIDEAFAPANER